MSIANITYLLFFLLGVIYYLFDNTKKKIIQFSRLQGGPKPYPILGNITLLFKQNIVEGLSQLKQKYSLPCNFWVWSDYYYVTDNPEEIKILLSNTNKSFQKAPFYDDLIKIILEDTLLLTTSNQVKKWKFERNIIVKAFAPSMWYKYTPVFYKKAKQFTPELTNVNDFCSLITILNQNSFNIFMENFMGIEITEKANEDDLLLNLESMVEDVTKRKTINRVLPHWFFKYFTEEGKKFYKRLNFIKDRFQKLIDDKRSELQKRNDFTENINKLILIEALLLREDNDFSTDDIFKQMILIYIASIDTSVLTLMYTLLTLGMHPKIQEKVFEEVLETCRDDKEIQPTDLNNFKYMEQCIFETIRLFPVIPLVGRHITEDIEIGNKTIPKGANVLISPYLVHRNEKYWPDSERFDPSRFSPDNSENIITGSYIPFLIGPRDCLGRYYSLTQVKIMLAHILKDYQVQVDPKVAQELKFKYYIVIRPDVNFEIKFVPRKASGK